MSEVTRKTIQAKLTVSEPGDAHELEADRVADAVMRTPATQVKYTATVASTTSTAQVQRMCTDCGEEQKHAALSQVGGNSGSGTSLDQVTRSFMEPRFGRSFADVRIHTGGQAARSAEAIGAAAYTVGRDIVFGADRYAPHFSEGRRLIAHELTHVVQQSQSAGNVPSLQRDGPKPGSAAAKIETAKNELKTKFGLKDVSEEGGAVWTESQLKKLGTAFSKMSSEEQLRLRGVTLVLRTQIETKRIKGKTFTISGRTYGTYRVELTPSGLRDTVLHEAGHLIHNTAIANAEEMFRRSQFKADLETARAAFNASAKRGISLGAGQEYLGAQIKAVVAAAGTFELSGDDDRAANRAALEAAEMSIPFVGSGADSQALSAYVDKLRAFVAALLLWSDEREKAVGPYKRLDEFVSIVNKHKLARRSAAFTPYAEANWPDKPAEFFSEAYQAWRKDPADMKKNSKPLFDWFEKGGHLGPKIPPPRQPIKIPIPTKIPALHQHAPVIEELLLEMGQTFLPAIEGGLNLIP